MSKFVEVNPEELRVALATAPTVKATNRLMVAIAYADGIRVETLSERYGIPRATVYSWLDRFEHHSISEAITDESRSGRPSKLDASQRERLSTDLAQSPAELCYDASEWTPKHAQQHIERTYGVAYSLGHVRRWLRELSVNIWNSILIRKCVNYI